MNALTIKRAVRVAGKYLPVASMVLGLAGVTLSARAQGSPNYVVTTHSTALSIPQGPAYGIGVNSRGDFFINAGAVSGGPEVIEELPADGSPVVPIFTIPSGIFYYISGVSVDSNDNVLIAVYGTFGGNAADPGVYKVPFTNGTYPTKYVYSQTTPPSPCNGAVAATATTPAVAANTNVCALGAYQGVLNYYLAPLAVTADYTGASYMFTGSDNTANKSGNRETFYYCSIICNEQELGGEGLVLVNNLPYSLQGFAGNPVDPKHGGAPGDIYFVDGHTVSYIVGAAAQGATGNSATVTLLDSTYNNPTGISFDKSGNLYVVDATGIWETPLVSGQLVANSKFLIFSLGSNALANAAPDTLGDVYYSPYYGDVEKGQIFSGTYPPLNATTPGTPIGTTSATLTFTITFNNSVTLASITPMQGNAPAKEFAVYNGSCAAGATYAKGSTCNFYSGFTPSAAGPRSGSIVVTDSTGASTVTYLKGVGIGTAVTIDPGTPVLIGNTGLQTPEGLALDPAGNVFIADPAANAVYEYPVGGGAAVSIGSNLNVPTGVAADAAGNVFIVNQGTAAVDASMVGEGTVVEVPNIAGTLTTASQSTVFTGLELPTDIVLDATGNFYISNTAANEVRQYPSVSRYGTNSTSVSSIALGSSLNAPTGLGLDAGNHLYIADTGNNRVVELAEGFATVVGAGLSTPTGVAVDASGSVIIADQGTGRLLRVPFETLPIAGLNSDDQVLVDSPLLYPTSLRLDSGGNLYGSDKVEKEIYELQRTLGEIDFQNYNLNTVSSAETIVLSNAGNLPITLGSPLYAPVAASSGFSVGNSASAVQPSATHAGTLCPTGMLPVGDNCVLSAVFSPTVAGPVTYPLELGAPATNSQTPTVDLVGVGVNLDAATATISVSSPTSPISYGEDITVVFTLTPTGSTVAPTGVVQFEFDGQNFGPKILGADGTVSYTFTNQNAGQHTVQAHYEGDTNYPSVSTAVLPITINLATALNVLTITADSSTPLSAKPTATVSFSVSLAPSVGGLFQGTVTFYENGVAMATENVNGPTATDPNYSAYYTNNTLPLGFYTITAAYSGNANYAAVTSAPVQLVISNPTFTVTPSTDAVTATKATPAVINLNVEAYSDFQAGVDFACTGLPANAYCIFRPGLATLQNKPYTTPTIVPPVAGTLKMVVDESPVVVEGSTGSIGWIGAVFAMGLLLYSRRKRSLRGLIGMGLLVFLTFGGIVALNGCGGNTTNYVTPPGTYLITVTATATPLNASGGVGLPSSNVSTTFQINLTVK